MPGDEAIEDCIRRATEPVGPAWPLHSFVTANPLADLEDRPFHEAVDAAGTELGADGLPDPETLERAWEEGRIDPDLLEAHLEDHGRDPDPEASLRRIKAHEDHDAPDRDHAWEEVDRHLSKWMASFTAEGGAGWPMPRRDEGFWPAFRALARHDRSLPNRDRLDDLPEDPLDTVRTLLADKPAGRWEAVLRQHLTSLPGWTALAKQRAEAETDPPLTLAGVAATRLALATLLEAPLDPDPETDEASSDDEAPERLAWLEAWEATYRRDLVEGVAEAAEAVDEDPDEGRPETQLAFCIDTRSEVLRRHLEAAGPHETVGYAGFFGVPIRWEGHGDDPAYDACPPMVEARHRVGEAPDETPERARHRRWTALRSTAEDLLTALQTNAATAFSFVEAAGPGYGAAMAARTLAPGPLRDLVDGIRDHLPSVPDFSTPDLDRDPTDDGDLPKGMTLDEKVAYAAQAFELTGWDETARLVAFVGHGSTTANNPYAASLHCGACAGNPGGPNARVLAAICNDDAVQDRLRDRGIEIPADTVFVAGEHDTTTDEVTLYADDVPESHQEDLAALRRDLEAAGEAAARERVGGDDPVDEARRRSADWAETRPEWGLAGNAGFVVGPREVTSQLDLDGRAFLHSYDWSNDPDGDALEAILEGPMVVTQWINAQYYFSTVDNAAFGGGSKVTQNPVGNVGVYQGNGGDLMTGLPRESLYGADGDPYHQPLRLSTVLHAPVDRVTGLLARRDDLADLLDHGWLSLAVVDPTRGHAAFRYEGDLTWRPIRSEALPRAEAPTPTAEAATGTR